MQRYPFLHGRSQQPAVSIDGQSLKPVRVHKFALIDFIISISKVTGWSFKRITEEEPFGRLLLALERWDVGEEEETITMERLDKILVPEQTITQLTKGKVKPEQIRQFLATGGLTIKK